ncbi:MAG: hypothetical protein A2Z14_17750 [Chloroflexi bacterium RBG_16_48_8]|nr:MAG: hypothetical protein A2Z14_17750 [Chloroflexi bacterium RBG_16_48_8]
MDGITSVGLLIFLCAGLILRGGYRFPDYPSIGDYPDEKALVYLTKTLEPGSRVGTYAPLNAWAAKLVSVNMSVQLRSLETPQKFVQWMQDEKLQAIYVEGALRSAEASVWSLIQEEIGKSLEVGFTTGEDGIQVYLVSMTQDPN